MAVKKKKGKWIVKLLKAVVMMYLLLILFQLIADAYSKLSVTHNIPVSEEWNLIIVNRWNELPEDYSVELMELSNGQKIDSRIYPALQEMFDAARAEGIYPIVREGYRTAEEQQEILDEKIQIYINQGYSQSRAERTAKEWVALSEPVATLSGLVATLSGLVATLPSAGRGPLGKMANPPCGGCLWDAALRAAGELELAPTEPAGALP